MARGGHTSDVVGITAWGYDDKHEIVLNEGLEHVRATGLLSAPPGWPDKTARGGYFTPCNVHGPGYKVHAAEYIILKAHPTESYHAFLHSYIQYITHMHSAQRPSACERVTHLLQAVLAAVPRAYAQAHAHRVARPLNQAASSSFISGAALGDQQRLGQQIRVLAQLHLRVPERGQGPCMLR